MSTEKKTTLREQLSGLTGNLFGEKVAVRKTYDEIVGAFAKVKSDLADLVAERNLTISGIDLDIERLTKEKEDAAQEKAKAEETFAFLGQFIK